MRIVFCLAFNVSFFCSLLALSDERRVSDVDGIFLVEHDPDAKVNQRLLLAIWRNGWAVRDNTPREVQSNYLACQLSDEAVEQLKRRIMNDGLLTYKKPLLNYGIPDGPLSFLTIRMNGHSLEMASCIEQFESANMVVAIESGLIPRAGRSRTEVLSTLSQEFLFKRLVWSETIHTIERSLLGFPTKVIAGELLTREGALIFKYEVK